MLDSEVKMDGKMDVYSEVSGLLALACLLIVGCGGNDGLIEISGQVRYDGQPVQSINPTDPDLFKLE